MIKHYTGLFLLLLLSGCGGSGSGTGETNGQATGNGTYHAQVQLPENYPCEADAFYRIKQERCVKLKHPAWGFQGFATERLPLLRLETCTQEALLSLLERVPAGGARVQLPACRIEMEEVIALYDNMVFEGAGIDRTLIVNRSGADVMSLRGKNIVVRNLTLDGEGKALGGIVGTNNRGNILIEKVAIRNLKGSGVYLETAKPQADAKITVRLSRIYGTLHGIVVKMRASAKLLFYSNELFGNREYGIDMSTTGDIEVSGNYMHDNYYAGAKSPLADGIYYYHNDINRNGRAPERGDRAGIVYMGKNLDAKIYLEYNDLRNNGGLAFATWDGAFSYLLLRENIVTGSEDSNGYNIRATGVSWIDVYGDHGRIWVGEGNEGRIHYH